MSKALVAANYVEEQRAPADDGAGFDLFGRSAA